jgi:electron transfer flavoprotein alpha subunit
MRILILADHAGSLLQDATARVVTAAQAIGGSIDVLVAGHKCDAAARACTQIDGVGRVLLADDPALEHQLPEVLAALLVDLAQDYDAILGSTGAVARRTLPRVAAKLDVMQLSDVIAIVSPSTYKRPAYAGNAIETIETSDAKLVITVRRTAFPAAAARSDIAPIVAVSMRQVSALGTQFVGRSQDDKNRIDLASARRVVAGGRALGSRENFDRLIQPLAGKLGAAVGASRAAVDAGFVPSDCQVGQTGKVVAPELYIALGISGAIQHLAGMQDSKIVVAINKDPNAPIFSVADYGLAQDIFDAVPELIAKI